MQCAFVGLHKGGFKKCLPSEGFNSEKRHLIKKEPCMFGWQGDFCLLKLGHEVTLRHVRTLMYRHACLPTHMLVCDWVRHWAAGRHKRPQWGWGLIFCWCQTYWRLTSDSVEFCKYVEELSQTLPLTCREHPEMFRLETVSTSAATSFTNPPLWYLGEVCCRANISMVKIFQRKRKYCSAMERFALEICLDSKCLAAICSEWVGEVNIISALHGRDFSPLSSQIWLCVVVFLLVFSTFSIKELLLWLETQ